MAQINFFVEDITFKLSTPTKIKRWLTEAANSEGHKITQLTYIFTSDRHLHKINLQYLKHDTLTDIITFDQSEKEGELEGDIFISIPRIQENAKKFEVSFDDELHRVLIHGLLHLIGYTDKTKVKKLQMTKKEDHYLSLR